MRLDKLKNINSNNGFVLVAVTIVMSVLILLVFYFLDFVMTDSKISQSQNLSTQTYYLAEAGIQEAIWKINNDPDWLDEFQTNPDWEATIDRENPFDNNQSYHIEIANTDLGNAQITTTGQFDYGSKQSQRVVKTTAFQAQGPPPPPDEPVLPGIAIYSDRNMNFTAVDLDVIGAGLFTNGNFNPAWSCQIDIEGNVSAVGRISIPWGTTLNAALLEATNYPPAPEIQEMPQVDFNSDDPDSLINSADEVYTSNEFNNLLNNNSEVNLNGIIYVQGNINIPRDTVLTINGALVSEGHISIGAYWWPFWEPKPSLIINDPGSGPVGLLSMRKISFESEVDSIDITGLIYATDKLTFWVYGLNFDLTAGIITRQLIINSLWQPIVINYDQELIARTLGSPATAPIIDVEHWEEEY